MASVQDGGSALSACRDSCVDVLVADVQRPPESGPAVVRTLVDKDLAIRFVSDRHKPIARVVSSYDGLRCYSFIVDKRRWREEP